MNLIVIMVIILVVFGFIAMVSAGSSSQSGGAKRKFGLVGLLIFLFGILGISSYFQKIN